MERAIKIVGGLLAALVSAGVVGGFVSRSVAREEVGPTNARLVEHIAKTEADPARLSKMDEKLDLLLEDCFRRGGCKR